MNTFYVMWLGGVNSYVSQNVGGGANIDDVDVLKKEIERVGDQIREMKASATDKVCVFCCHWQHVNNLNGLV